MNLSICDRAVSGTLLLLLSATSVLAGEPTRVAPRGNTHLSARGAENRMVEIAISTHIVPLLKETQGTRRQVGAAACTYSRRPCSSVDQLTIKVNETALFVPRSVICDLSDINTMEVVGGDNIMKLELHGGDASESYSVTIEFDKAHVKRRVVTSGIAPVAVLQETIYNPQPLGE
jgi:hypothetical protein